MNKTNNDEKSIEIYVSTRIDQKTRVIPNPLFIPVRCGACFDTRDNITIQGDNTGDNISDQREFLCELTVLYWAWKNSKADYYGLQHYRRFLSFADDEFESPALRLAYFDDMTDANLKKADLIDESKMRDEIERYDLIIAKHYDIHKDAHVPGFINSIYEFWMTSHPEFISKENFDILFEQIKENYPDYYDDAIAYKNGDKFLGFNCCIGNRETLNDLCSFLFDVLFKIQSKLIIDDTFSEQNKRVAGYMAEWLFSIWCYRALKQKKYNIKETQLIAFMNTEVSQDTFPIEKSISVVYQADIYNIPELAISIQSIINNANSKNTYDIILLAEYLPAGNEEAAAEKMLIQTLKEQICPYKNISLRICHPQEYIGELNRQDIKNKINHKKTYTTLLPWILNEYSRVVYLSSKMIVKSDVADLYNIVLDDYMIGGTYDFYFMDQVLKNRNLNHDNIDFIDQPYAFISTDVLVFDLNKIRNKYSKDEIIEYFIAQEKLTGDEVFNHFFEKDINHINFEWNYYGIQDEYFNIMIRDNIPQRLKKDFKKVKQAKIINLRAEGHTVPLLEAPVWHEFWRIARETAFYEVLIQKWCLGLYPHQQNISFARKVANKLLPKGSYRREYLKKIIPRDSKQWNFLKRIYHIISLD